MRAFYILGEFYFSEIGLSRTPILRRKHIKLY